MTIRDGIVVGALILGIAGDAWAGSPEMTRLFEQGRALVKDGQYDAAVAKFVESIAIEPSVGALLNLGDCYEKLGKPASARRRFLEAAELAGEGDAVRSAEARARAAKLDGVVARIVVRRRGEVEGRVTIDGEPVPARVDRVEVDPGAHEIIVTFPDVAPDKRSVSVRGAQSVDVIVEAPAKAPQPPKPNEPDRITKPTDEGWGGQQWAGVGVGALGVVALGVGATFGVIALGKKSDLDAACPAYPRCPEAQRAGVQTTYDDAHRAATLATVGVIAGTVLVAGGVVLWLTAPVKKTSIGIGSATAGGMLRLQVKL